MAKHPGVNHYRSGKNSNQEVVVYKDEAGYTNVTVVDWTGMRVSRMSNRPVETPTTPLVATPPPPPAQKVATPA